MTEFIHQVFVLNEPEPVVLVHYVKLGHFKNIELRSLVVLKDDDFHRVDFKLPVDAIVTKAWDYAQYHRIDIKLVPERSFRQFLFER
jgi:hypothetical protein